MVKARSQLLTSYQGLRVAEVIAENFICTLNVFWCPSCTSVSEKPCQKLSRKRGFLQKEIIKKISSSVCPIYLLLACGHLQHSPKPSGNQSPQAAPTFLSPGLGTPAPFSLQQLLSTHSVWRADHPRMRGLIWIYQTQCYLFLTHASQAF